jgi:hypothetical protein
MEFPTIVYQCPGPHQCHGATYRYIGVADDAELSLRLSEGWFVTLPEAMAGEADAPDDNAPPTRAELEKMAGELGIKFDGRTTDALLRKKIDAELGG